jgi:hypothetical protein
VSASAISPTLFATPGAIVKDALSVGTGGGQGSICGGVAAAGVDGRTAIDGAIGAAPPLAEAAAVRLGPAGAAETMVSDGAVAAGAAL